MLKIFIEGLIVFVRIPRSTVTRAVLIREASHIPQLWLENSDIDSFPPVNPLPVLAGSPPTQSHYNLDTQLLKIGLPSGVATLHVGGFDDHVPNLTYALQGSQSLHPDIFGRSLYSNAYAYVDLEGGALEAVTCFDPQVTWSIPNNNLPICIARLVLFSVDVTGSVAVTNAAGQGFTVKDFATLHLSNRKYGGNHFPMYQSIAPTSTGISVPTETNLMCVQCAPTNQPFPDQTDSMEGMNMGGTGGTGRNVGAKPKAQFDPTVECANTQWP